MKLTIDTAASSLLDSESTQSTRGPLSHEWPELDLETAYLVQDKTVSSRILQGDRKVATKLGVFDGQPVFGQVTASQIRRSGSPVITEQFTLPMLEPGIVFLLESPLKGPGITAAQSLGAVKALFSGVSLLSSRFSGDDQTSSDFVADNLSITGIYIGPVGQRCDGIDLSKEACLISANSKAIDSATGAAIFGHPAEALALAANECGKRGKTLEAGQLVFSSGMVTPKAIHPGSTLTFRWTNLGTITIGTI